MDNASNNGIMLNHLISTGYIEGKEHHIRCFAHILNLAVQDLLGCSDYLLTKIRTIIKWIRSDENRVARLRKLCDLNDEPISKLISDTPTRWNSTWEMLGNAFQKKKSIAAFLANDGTPITNYVEVLDNPAQPANPIRVTHDLVPLNDFDWNIIGEMCRILKTYERCNGCYGKGKNPYGCTYNAFL